VHKCTSGFPCCLLAIMSRRFFPGGTSVRVKQSWLAQLHKKIKKAILCLLLIWRPAGVNFGIAGIRVTTPLTYLAKCPSLAEAYERERVLLLPQSMVRQVQGNPPATWWQMQPVPRRYSSTIATREQNVVLTVSDETVSPLCGTYSSVLNWSANICSTPHDFAARRVFALILMVDSYPSKTR